MWAHGCIPLVVEITQPILTCFLSGRGGRSGKFYIFFPASVYNNTYYHFKHTRSSIYTLICTAMVLRVCVFFRVLQYVVPGFLFVSPHKSKYEMITFPSLLPPFFRFVLLSDIKIYLRYNSGRYD